MENVLRLKNLTLKFDEHVVLKSIDLEVKSGEALVLVGPSGMGKTSILKLFAGIIEPSSGEALIENKSWNSRSHQERAALSKKVGMLFQKNALFDSFTCAENIAFPLRETTNLDDASIASRVKEFLNAVGIPHAHDLFPDEISGGMQKRLGIARALALNPEIIFYDDPTAGLDPITSKKIIELIIKLQRERKSTVVAITNDMNRAYQLATKIALVVDHQVIVTGSPDQTKQHTDPRVQQFIHGSLQGPLTAELVETGFGELK